MGLLRACADALVIGSGTLAASPRSVWTAEQAFPDAADGVRRAPASGSGGPPSPRSSCSPRAGCVDPAHPSFEAGALVLTTDAGAARLDGRLPAASTVVSLGRSPARLRPRRRGAPRPRPPADPLRGRPARARLAARGRARRRALPDRVAAPRRAVRRRRRLALVEGADLLPGGPLECTSARRPPRRRPSLPALRARLVAPRRSVCPASTRKHRIGRGRRGQALSGDVADQPSIEPDGDERGSRGVAGGPDRLGRAAGHRLPRPRLPARRLPPARLRALDELLVRRAATPSSATASSTTRSPRSFGIKLLAVLSVAASAAAFTLVVRQTWGESTVWATRFFALVAAASLVTAAFPYGLGLAFALTALVAVARRRIAPGSRSSPRSRSRRARSRSCSCSSCSRRPPSRAHAARDREAGRDRRRDLRRSALVLWRLFPDPGRYPFATGELHRRARLLRARRRAHLAGRARADPARALRRLRRASASLAYVIPSNLGENVVRLRFAALPIAVLTLSLRRWRPLPLAVLALALAFAGTSRRSPTASPAARTTRRPHARYWQPVIGFLHRSLSPDYRVEAVGTADHWEAVYLAAGRRSRSCAAGSARTTSPRTRCCTTSSRRARTWRWLRQLSVRYVVLTDAAPDYSAKNEVALLRSGRSGLAGRLPLGARRRSTPSPRPRPIVTGPGNRGSRRLTGARSRSRSRSPAATSSASATRPTSPPRRPASARPGRDDRCSRRRAPGRVKIAFSVSASGALAALTGSRTTCAEAH